MRKYSINFLKNSSTCTQEHALGKRKNMNEKRKDQGEINRLFHKFKENFAFEQRRDKTTLLILFNKEKTKNIYKIC